MAVGSGNIIEDYPYLWLRQYRAGETEGRKPRPVCVAVAVKDRSGLTHLALLPISSQTPQRGQTCVPVPISERRRAGLDEDKQLWVYVSEYNYDIVEGSFYLSRRAAPRKAFSERFL